MRIFTALFIFFISLTIWANDKYETSKINCILQSNYNNKTIDELKRILVEQSKREALEELYGTTILSKTDVLNGKLVTDEIKQKAVGSVRLKGNPEFYNGENFGEICSKVHVYITKKDLEKYSPKSVILNNFCFNDTSITLKDLKQKAKEKAYIEMITRFKPEFKDIKLLDAKKYIHKFIISNETFDTKKESYCFDARGDILPHELELTDISSIKSNKDNGLYVSFFKKSDYGLQNEIFDTKLKKDLSLFNENFTNDILKKEKVYVIRISGYLYSERIIHKKFKLESDVNNATLKINNSVVLTKKNPIGGITLDLGFNKIEMIINSKNAYDIKLLEKQKNNIYSPIKLENLYTRKSK
ncbi:hypothetical protein [Poseidonibacter ostreae]|jgi:hypothetical protein|uniref:Uncharacterized protein n=1 Tax=Poseidonibacter ostreae TaxID=2654171 RepID=A0A6L4WUC5_9BACT|nr:hypothetical protein [Poseidonibacter ostreae]KAB7883093.1 hypothetical protein GA417_13100 [Poseidonibacter ostreae]KAB7888198.1 hypothetical protein GBG19_09565 [Poseidonibacter ostreae]KAB7892026.1 hypothetical protein GBG18_04530 [Poseidonibacter ostreae]